MRAFSLPAIFRKAVASLKIIHTFALAFQLIRIISIRGTRFGNPYNRNINFLQSGRCVRKQQLVMPQGIG